jgi:hypothetical protein
VAFERSRHQLLRLARACGPAVEVSGVEEGDTGFDGCVDDLGRPGRIYAPSEVVTTKANDGYVKA